MVLLMKLLEDRVVDESLGCQLKSSSAADLINYEGAIKKLNALQSNAATIQKSQSEGPVSHVEQTKKVESTAKYLSRVGISLDQLDRLSIVHIAGTKGKGTTAALCESILRQHGYRTGFFSSPHLVAVRERIRIDGVPISQKKFADYFDYVYSSLEKKKDNEMDMPAYFKFLTVMAFHVFLREYVDVAIVEVGIGGEYDCTNCIKNPAVVGITTLGLDHTNILGTTLPDIAWQKAGIFKPGSRAFTVPQPSPFAMDVLREKARNRQCFLTVAPPLDSYTWDVPHYNHVEDVYSTNASLALQLANSWLQLQSPFISETEDINSEDNETVVISKPFRITKKMSDGLNNCSWPGRTQVITRGNITYFLDGAHTADSISYCLEWFNSASSAMQTEPERSKRVLVFNITGQRKSDQFLRLLESSNFDRAVFPAIVPFDNHSTSSDQFSLSDSESQVFKHLEHLSASWKAINEANESQIFTTVSEAFSNIEAYSQGEPCHVLITGSVHLIGASLCVLDPSLSEPVTRIPAGLRPLQSIYSTVQALL